MRRANISAHLLTQLRPTSQISALLAEATARLHVETRLKEVLPVSLRDRVSIQPEENRLLLLADNNAVAQLLRFHSDALLKASGCHEVSIRIGSPAVLAAPAAEAPVRRYLSAASSQLLNEAAADFTDNPELATALRNLARHVTKPD